MADDNGSDRTPRLGGWRNDMRVAAGEAAAAGGCGKAELLWMALGKRANTKVGEDWRNEKRVAAGEAAAAGAAGRPSCCAWRMAIWQWQGAREACEHQGWGGLAQ